MKSSGFLVPFCAVAAVCLFGAMAQSNLPKYQVRTLTTGQKHHFFGYYGIPPWNQSGKYLVCLESDFQDHLPKPEEAAAVGLVDAKTGVFKKVGETRAWNLQQGAMLYWNPLDPENEVIFNDRRADQPGKIGSVALNVKTGKKRYLPLAIAAVSHNGRHALSSAMFTCNLDGSDLREVVPFGKGVSHFEWRNAKEILATFRFNGDEMKHVLFTDGEPDYQAIGEGFLQGDGHCSFAPDGQWIVTDRNVAATREKMLMIFHTGMKQGLLLGTFPMKEYLSGDLRCDLHPRWNRTGDAICFDALETRTWTRQLHVAFLDFK